MRANTRSGRRALWRLLLASVPACGGARAARGTGSASEIEFRPAGAEPAPRAAAASAQGDEAAASQWLVSPQPLLPGAPVPRSAVGRIRPTNPVPQGSPPPALAITDVVVGAGREALPGTRPEVHYVGVAWSTGAVFDASWDRGQPFSFGLGQRQVIEGWDRGVVGMREGGRRQIVIPPAMGYGARGAGGAIGPNETLIFVVDLIAVH